MTYMECIYEYLDGPIQNLDKFVNRKLEVLGHYYDEFKLSCLLQIKATDACI